jgi:hypothetical protein
MGSGTVSVSDLDEISRSLATGSTSQGTQSTANTSKSLGDVASNKPSSQTSADKDKTTAKFVTANIRDLERDPEEIFSAKEIIKALYSALDDQWPGNPNFKMILTYFLCRSNTQHLIKEPLPMIDRVEKIIEDTEKDGDTWTTAYQFYNRARIPSSSFKNVKNFLATVAPEFAKDAYTDIEYQVTDGMDGDVKHRRPIYRKAKQIAKPGDFIHRHQNGVWTDSFDHEGNKIDTHGMTPDSSDTDLQIAKRDITSVNSRTYRNKLFPITKDVYTPRKLAPSLVTIRQPEVGDVPIKSKDNSYFDAQRALTLGAKFDPNRGWYVPKNADLDKFPKNWF